MLIKKRNGSTVNYDPTKIFNAINAANESLKENKVSQDAINLIYSRACSKVENWSGNHILSVEDINDMVEESMLSVGCLELMRTFIEYRYLHKLIRQSNTTDESILSLIRQTNKEVMNENSNKDARNIPTQRDLIAGIVSRDITSRLLLPKNISEAHEKGWIHYHDTDYAISPITNCCLVNIKDMLDNGTMMNGKLVETPKSFQVACTVMTQIIAAVASSQYGGQSVDISHLSKYLKKSEDKFTNEINNICGDEVSAEIKSKLVSERMKKELSAGIQTIQYQINTLMTTNGQSPFVTIFMYLKKDDPYKKYTAAIIAEILNQRILGIKNEKGVYITPAFPKLVYVLTEENIHGEYKYLTELAARCSAKRMYPDYISEKIMKENTGYCFSPMGCRSFLSPYYDENGEVKFEGRFNQGVVSLNLPNVALTALKENRDFWEILEERLALCKEALMFRHRSLLGTKAKVAPILWRYGAIARLDGEETIDKLLKDNYSSISLGYIGVYETTLLMTGGPQTTEKGREFSLKLLNKLREACDTWKAEEHIGFALYGTPAESLCYRFARIDKKTFGDIKDVTDKNYYTNSYHVDVREVIDAFSKLKAEAPYQKISNGGCISYVELPNMGNNIEALMTLINYIYDNIQYAEFNLKCDYCYECGYDGEMIIGDDNNWHCPNCGNSNHEKMNVIRRVCGYLGENGFNNGKISELKSRCLHL